MLCLSYYDIFKPKVNNLRFTKLELELKIEIRQVDVRETHWSPIDLSDAVRTLSISNPTTNLTILQLITNNVQNNVQVEGGANYTIHATTNPNVVASIAFDIDGTRIVDNVSPYTVPTHTPTPADATAMTATSTDAINGVPTATNTPTQAPSPTPTPTPLVVTIWLRVEAESFVDAATGVFTANTYDPQGGGALEVRDFDATRWLRFDDVNLSPSPLGEGLGVRAFRLRADSPNSGSLLLRVGSPTAPPFCTLAWAGVQVYSLQEVARSLPVSGVQTVYLTNDSVQWINVNWFAVETTGS
jgi:hypothetical protein